jgi:plastocyanin
MKRLYVFGFLFMFLASLLGQVMPAAAAQTAIGSTGGMQTYSVIVGAENVTRGITVNAFFPAVLHVHVGDTVVWKQNSHEIHTVTFLAGEPCRISWSRFPTRHQAR